jgi:hypothetical protein
LTAQGQRDPRVPELVNGWLTLPEALKVSFLAMLKAAKGE